MSHYKVELPGEHPIAVGDEVVGRVGDLVAYVDDGAYMDDGDLRWMPRPMQVELRGRVTPTEWPGVISGIEKNYYAGGPPSQTYLRLREHLLRVAIMPDDAGRFASVEPVSYGVRMFVEEASLFSREKVWLLGGKPEALNA